MRPNGCCITNDKKNRCCCGIDQHSNHCTSVKQQFKVWMEWNECNANATFDNIEHISLVENLKSKIKMNCAYATIEKHQCLSPVSLCLYENTRHNAWGGGFPFTSAVGTFFLQALCYQQDGKWDIVKGVCVCCSDSLFTGLYCITRKTVIAEITEIITTITTEAENVNDDAIEIVKNESGKVVGENLNVEKEITMDDNTLWMKMSIYQAFVLLCSLIFAVFAVFVICKKANDEYSYSLLSQTQLETIEKRN